MLIEHTITRLNDMRLTGMSEAYSSQRERPNIDEFSFDERFSLLVDQEWTYRQNRRLARLLKAAKLRLPACVERHQLSAATRLRSKPRGSPCCMRLDHKLAECLDHWAYGRRENIHSLRPGPLRLSPRVQRAVLQSAAPPI